MQLLKFAFQTGVLPKGMESVPLHQFLHINDVLLVLAMLSNKNYRVWFEVPYIFKGVLKDVMLPITFLPCPSMVMDHNAAFCREVPPCVYNMILKDAVYKDHCQNRRWCLLINQQVDHFMNTSSYQKNTIFSHIYLTSTSSTSSTLVWPASELVSGQVTLSVE